MSKVKARILEILSDGNWHTSTEIVEMVSASMKTSRLKVYQVISNLSGGHLIVKENIGGGMCRYRAQQHPGDFGISVTLSLFDRLIRQERAR